MSFKIAVEPLGAEVDIAEGQTLLDACLRSGVWLPHACGHGLCGTCKVRVTEGDVEIGEASPFALMDFERDEGVVLACCATAQSDVTIEAEIDEEPDARVIPVRDFDCEVVGLEALTPTILGIRLRTDTAMDFQAGQYVNVHIPGLAHARAFSIANAPEDGSGCIELNVRRVPNGQGTAWLHEQLKVGMPLRVSGPMGRFFVRSSDPQPVLFMAGGSGLSSPRSMILDLLARGDRRAITLVYGARNRAELYYHDAFLELQQQHPQFEYVPALSEPTPACAWDGFKGFVHEAAQAHFNGDFRGRKAYLCGPPPMIEGCIRTLMQGRLFERDIYTERFLSSADAAASNTRSPLFKSI